jgi:hypothetical protein
MNGRATKAVRKYLEQWASPEAALAGALNGGYNCALIVPVRDEQAAFIDGLMPALVTQSGVLLIVVVNSDAACSEAVRASNRSVLEDVRNRGASRELSGVPGCVLVNTEACDVLLLDRSSDGMQLPAKTGAGLARKIGCDIAAALWAQGKFTQPWLFNTDADVTLPVDYFRHQAEPEGVGALLYPFWHEAAQGDQAVTAATAAYETWLRYYVLALAWAGSPYAFHTVGSAFAVHARAYCEARGMPKRDAAEDFHLLAKVAKLAPLQRVSPLIAIQSRRSARAPIGTGARVAALLSGSPLLFYNPQSFVVLRAVLQGLRHWAAAPRADEFNEALSQLPQLQAALASKVLNDLGLNAAFQHCVAQGGAGQDRLIRLHTWFDALNTLHLLHELQRDLLPAVSWAIAASQAEFLSPISPTLADPAAAAPALEELEMQLPKRVGPTLLRV